MNATERQLLDLAVEMSSQLANIVEQLGEKVVELEERLEAMDGSLATAYVDASVSKLLIAEIFAELADGNRDRLDRAIANSTSLAETLVAQSEDDGGRLLQATLNDLIESAEQAFDRRGIT